MTNTSVPNEQSSKQWVRANSRAGANSFTGNPLPVSDAIPNSGTKLYTLLVDPESEFISFGNSTSGKTVHVIGEETRRVCRKLFAESRAVPKKEHQKTTVIINAVVSS